MGKHVGLGAVVQVGKALILDPGNVEAGLVAGEELLIAEHPPAALGVPLGIPNLLTLTDGSRFIALDKVR